MTDTFPIPPGRASRGAASEPPDDALWLAARIVAAKHDLVQGQEEAKRTAQPGAPGFAGDAAERFDRTVARLAADAPDAQSRTALAAHLQGFRAALLDEALRFEAGARVARRAETLATTIDLARRTVALAPGTFDALRGDVARAIDSQPIAASRKAALTASAQRSLAEAWLQGLLARDPDAAAQALRSGRLDALLDPEARSRWQREIAARRDALQSDHAMPGEAGTEGGVA